MSEEKMTVAQDVAATLASALIKAGKSTGIVIAIAMEDDSIWFHTAGDLVTKLGLIKALEHKSGTMWENLGSEEDNTEETSSP